LGAQSAAATSTADFQRSWFWREVGITALAKLPSEELSARGIAAVAGARAIGLSESNGMAL
jgi:hypothetical protein